MGEFHIARDVSGGDLGTENIDLYCLLPYHPMRSPETVVRLGRECYGLSYIVIKHDGGATRRHVKLRDVVLGNCQNILRRKTEKMT